MYIKIMVPVTISQDMIDAMGGEDAISNYLSRELNLAVSEYLKKDTAEQVEIFLHGTGTGAPVGFLSAHEERRKK